MAKEKKLQTKILHDLESRPDTECFKIMKANKDGVCDIWFTNIRTGPYLLEVKAPGEQPSKKQHHFIGRVNASGGVALWVDTWQGWVDLKKDIGLDVIL